MRYQLALFNCSLCRDRTCCISSLLYFSIFPYLFPGWSDLGSEPKRKAEVCWSAVWHATSILNTCNSCRQQTLNFASIWVFFFLSVLIQICNSVLEYQIRKIDSACSQILVQFGVRQMVSHGQQMAILQHFCSGPRPALFTRV